MAAPYALVGLTMYVHLQQLTYVDITGGTLSLRSASLASRIGVGEGIKPVNSKARGALAKCSHWSWREATRTI